MTTCLDMMNIKLRLINIKLRLINIKLRFQSSPVLRRQTGYTFIELAVVVLLIGLMLFLALPRVRHALLDDSLQSAARHLTAVAKELRNEAVREQMDYILHLDLNNNAVWTYRSDMTPEKRDERRKGAYKFTPDVKIADVYRVGQKKQIDGDATIVFFRRGYVQPTVLHLDKGGRAFTMVFQPFLSAPDFYDKYVEYNDLSLK